MTAWGLRIFRLPRLWQLRQLLPRGPGSLKYLGGGQGTILEAKTWCSKGFGGSLPCNPGSGGIDFRGLRFS